MITANQLRVGNLIYSNISGSVVVVTADIIRNYALGYYAASDNEPIQITRDWLRKLGFEADSYDLQSLKIKNGSMSFSLKSGNIRFTDLSGDEARLCKHIMYIHQLQNLVYALTGEDLVGQAAG